LRDIFSINIVGTGWQVYLHSITFSITFPKPLDPSTIKVYAGVTGSTSLSSQCSYESWDATIAGRCSVLPNYALTVTVPINRVYFSPTTAQLCILIIGLIFLLILSIYLIRFCYLLDHPDSDESPSLSPAEASQLLFGYVNTQVELLYLASQGKAQLTEVGTSDFKVTLTESAVDPIGSVLNSKFTPTQEYSGTELDRILCRDDVSIQAEWELRHHGYISGSCCTRPW
jgi:hypothetical protein